MSKTVFVTTGATIPFIPLLQQFLSTEIHTLLQTLGFGRLVIQYGSSLKDTDSSLYQDFIRFECSEHHFSSSSSIDSGNRGLEIVSFGFKTSLEDDIANADLVISHAGK